MKYSELKRWLQKQGCYKKSENSRHECWVNPLNGNIAFVGRHDSEDAKKGTVNGIITQLGLKNRKGE